MKKVVLVAVAVAVLMSAVSIVMALGGSSEETDGLKARLARLEAKEAVLSTFNQYLYGLDTGFGDDILDTFTEDAVLDVPNFPGAGGDDLHFEGRDDLAPLYEPYGQRPPHVAGGHHTSNIAVNVRLDLTHADVSSYFMTSNRSGVQGGRYEGVMRLEPDGKWRWETLTITSAWGFRSEHFETISEGVSDEYSPRGGHHAAYEQH
jgi:hypothetical protein